MSGGSMIAVLDADPDLGAALAESELAHARRAALAPLLTFKPGRWTWEPSTDTVGHLGLLIIDGLLTRSQVIGELQSTEFLGAGDILRPWASDSQAVAVHDASWTVVVPARIAVLDQDFAWRVHRWPHISAALLERAIVRSRSLSVRLAIHRAVRIQDRVQLMLWHLAHRWGHVTLNGTILPIPLTHEALAQLIGARRSPVTIALGNLKRQGLVERGPAGSWVLRGDPKRLQNATSERDGLSSDPRVHFK